MTCFRSKNIIASLNSILGDSDRNSKLQDINSCLHDPSYIARIENVLDPELSRLYKYVEKGSKLDANERFFLLIAVHQVRIDLRSNGTYQDFRDTIEAYPLRVDESSKHIVEGFLKKLQNVEQKLEVAKCLLNEGALTEG